MKNPNENQRLQLLLARYYTQIMELFSKVMEQLFQIHKKLEAAPAPAGEEWLSEQEARKLINRGRTWYFNRRKDGSLTHTYVGSEPHYSKESLLKFIEKNRKDAYRKND